MAADDESRSVAAKINFDFPKKGWHREMDHLKKFVAEQLIITHGYKFPLSQVFDPYRNGALLMVSRL